MVPSNEIASQPFKKLMSLIATSFSDDKENDPNMQVEDKPAQFTPSLLRYYHKM